MVELHFLCSFLELAWLQYNQFPLLQCFRVLALLHNLRKFDYSSSVTIQIPGTHQDLKDVLHNFIQIHMLTH
jgi:hypothetical protein